MYKRQPMGRSLRRQTFDNFDLSLYDDRPLPGGISPRQVMAKNLSTAKAFVQNFPDGGRSLLMTGPSGLGKTQMCIRDRPKRLIGLVDAQTLREFLE